jgi:predicted site-specific integrase-resolvase
MSNLQPPPLVADRLLVPEQTLAQWRYLGKGPAFIKVGRHVRYRDEDVEAWLEANRHGGDAA